MTGQVEKYFLDWEETFSAGVNLVGGKGWNLGRLAHYGFDVPLGGTVTTKAYAVFIQENGLADSLREVSAYASQSVPDEAVLIPKLTKLRESFCQGKLSEKVSKEISGGLISLGLADQPLAVRSSASAEDSQRASFAGIHDSFLNVQGLEQVLSSVKECYASLWTPRALLYRQKMGLKDTEVIPAVILMKMVKAAAAGIGFSCNPQSGRLDQIVINANYGLGESVVGGKADPDQYILDAKPFLPKIATKTIGRKQWMTVAKDIKGTELRKPALLGLNSENQVLSEADVSRLGLLILRISEALGEGEKPQDIEWVFNGEQFWLVQARPVTVLPVYTYPELKGQGEIWSNANFKDAAPMVISAINRQMFVENINLLLTAVLKEIGCIFPAGLQYARFYMGRLYLNPFLLQWEYYNLIGMTPEETNNKIGGYQPVMKLPETGKNRFSKTGFNKLKLMLAIGKIQRNSEKIVTKLRKHWANCIAQNLRELNDEEIVAALFQRQKQEESFFKLGILNIVAGLMLDLLVKALEKDFATAAPAVAAALLIGQGNITSAEQGYKLIALAEAARKDAKARQFFLTEPFQPLSWQTTISEGSDFKHKFREFLQEYGHRAVYEQDLSNPRWHEDPSYLLNYLRELLPTADLSKFKAKQKLQAENIRQKVNSAVPFYRLWKINWLVRQAVKGVEAREKSKSELIRLVDPLRELVLDIGRRLKEREILEDAMDIFHCSLQDVISILLGYWNGQGLKALVADRKARYSELQKLNPPDLIINEKASFAAPASLTGEGELIGMGVSGGRAKGKAKLLNHPEDGLDQNEVLVAPSTDPGWTPLFLKASGIIMETGGFLSHGAIVAREYGIPTVVNIPGVMNLIQNGDNVVVNGDEGKVYLDPFYT